MRLHRGLLVQHLGVGAAGIAPGGQAVPAAQLGDGRLGELELGRGVADLGRSHVQVVQAAAEDKGRARILELVHHQAAQDLGQGHHQPAGHRDRPGAAHQRRGRVHDRQAVLGHQQQLVHRRLGLLQRRAGLGVEQDVLLLDQRLVAAGHGRRHVDGPLATGPVVGHKDDRLGRVLQHQRHLHVVGQRRVDVGGNADGHHKVDVGQRVAQMVAVDDVGLGELAVLARLRDRASSGSRSRCRTRPWSPPDRPPARRRGRT